MMQMEPSYRPSLMDTGHKGSGIAPFAGSDLVLSPSQWSSHVVGKCMAYRVILSAFLVYEVGGWVVCLFRCCGYHLTFA